LRSDRRPSRDTIQRRLILAALGDLDTHATAEQIYAEVATKHPSISRATVYRNLARMAEAGDIANIGSVDGSAHYDNRLHGHCHFVCDSCGRIFDLSGDISAICAEVAEAHGHEARAHGIYLAGVCRDCKGRAQQENCQ